jgi:mono/diheme cytochrome c family protein
MDRLQPVRAGLLSFKLGSLALRGRVLTGIAARQLAGGLAACSLAADVTPPPGYRAPTAAQPASVGPVYPLVPPDTAGGAAIYAEKCEPCHGPTGQGDGSQAEKLPNPPTAIGSAEVARQSVPADWYEAVTNGNLDRFMPGFSGSLSDSQRWDVLAYVYSLSTSEADMEAGQAVYQAQCAACHGDQGRGDGPDAAGLGTPPADLSDGAAMTRRSGTDLFEAISQGAAPDMPAFGSTLSEAERWAVVSFLRSFTIQPAPALLAGVQPSLEPSAPTGQAAATQPPAGKPPAVGTEAVPSPSEEALTGSTPTPAGTAVAADPQEGQTGSISGQVVNATGKEIPAGLTVTLHGYDSMEEAVTLTTQTGSGGGFEFAGVEMPPDRVFIASVEYDQGTYSSDVIHPSSQDLLDDLQVTVYDSTTDPAALEVERMHVFFDFNTPGVVQVVELFLISNPSQEMVVPAGAGQAVVNFGLPEGATNLQFEQGAFGERYIQTQNGFGDSQPVAPGMGQHQVLFAYELPYERSLDLLLPLPLPVNAAVVMVPQVGVKAQGAALQEMGTRDVQGMSFQLYSAGDLPPGQPLEVKLSGRPSGASGAEGAGLVQPGSTSELVIGLGVFGVALVAAGIWLFRRRFDNSRPSRPGQSRGQGRGQGPSEAVETDEEGKQARDEDLEPPAAVGEAAGTEDVESLIDAIIALDDRYRAGELPDAAYQERRRELKARLRKKVGNG